MPGETKADVSGWTVDTAMAHVLAILEERNTRFQQRFEAQEKSVSEALASAALAVDKAETTSEKWRQNANEWRGTLSDRDRLLMPRSEFEAIMKVVDTRIQSVSRACVAAVLFCVAVITVVLLILRKG